MRKSSRFFFSIIALLGFFALFSTKQTLAGLQPPFGGEYTNLCGTGTAANAYTCSPAGGPTCDPNSGSCWGVYASDVVYRFSCPGQLTQCGSSIEEFKGSAAQAGVSIYSGIPCGQTVQLDVMSTDCWGETTGTWNTGYCSAPGSTTFGTPLAGYMVWYSGSCSQPKYRCSGSTCVRDDVNGTYNTSNCDNQCSATSTPPPQPAGSDCNTTGCSGCTGGISCTQACQNGGFGSVGWCTNPGSTNPGVCCTCGNSCPGGGGGGWGCSGGSCIQNGGPYPNSTCNNACTIPPTRYDCSGTQCIPVSNGLYTTSNCNNACVARYGCLNGCVPMANGPYTDSTCNNQCAGVFTTTPLTATPLTCTAGQSSQSIRLNWTFPPGAQSILLYRRPNPDMSTGPGAANFNCVSNSTTYTDNPPAGTWYYKGDFSTTNCFIFGVGDTTIAGANSNSCITPTPVPTPTPAPAATATALSQCDGHPPATVRNVTVSAGTSHNDLTWSTMSTPGYIINYYLILRKTSAQSWGDVGTQQNCDLSKQIGNSTSTGYSDTAVTVGTTYQYRILAGSTPFYFCFNDSGHPNTSAASGSVTVAACAQVNPPGPFSIAPNPPIASCSGTSPVIDVSWTASSNAASYTVFRSTNFGPVEILASGLTGQTYRDPTGTNNGRPGPVTGNTYHYLIRAINSISSTDTAWSSALVAPNCSPLLPSPSPSPSPSPTPAASSNSPFIQTTGGDVHSNTNINTPGGP